MGELKGGISRLTESIRIMEIWEAGRCIDEWMERIWEE